jgi:hypothetical protein
MTSSAHIDDIKAWHISDPVIMTAPPGPDLQQVSGQAWLLTCPRVITGRRQEASRG